MSQKTCATCRFWSPTEAGTEFGGALVGQCVPGGSDKGWVPQMFTLPAVALSWDKDSPWQPGAILLANARFSCVAWSARGGDHGQ
jgi:hypothetical protein